VVFHVSDAACVVADGIIEFFQCDYCSHDDITSPTEIPCQILASSLINNMCIFDTLQHVFDILGCEANQSCKCSV